MELRQMWNGHVTVVRLLPVSAKSKWSTDPEDSVENTAFWEATPSGESEMVYKGFDEIPFKIGKCVYIDMEQLDVEPKGDEAKAHWQLSSVKNSHSLSIELNRGWRDDKFVHGYIKMDIANQGAWPPFQGQHLTHWSVTLTLAE
jgi:hypothetical protein